MKVDIKKTLKWSISIAVITLVLAAIFSVISNSLLGGVTWAIGMLIVLGIVLIGVVFDIIGVAATAADETPLHAKASVKAKGAKHAIFICRNADRVSNFCNDVIGDISSVVSGTASAAVVLELVVQFSNGDNSTAQYVVSIVFTCIVSALTVGGKAFGKSFAINYATEIIYHVGRLFYFAEQQLHINILNKNNKKKKVAKRNVK
ncbi:hypothetical protein EV207_10372 [Scopulibacillus darangshiensis]|uniref:CNNM transmembrane domain-containing protein n=1 Tax=Scopulibacillus darangshiensis TaxID=442528 RepID=A0A4R2P886_9BACL|nr:hypothetical protein [Scopulibacillus darangshiensis]TCP31189.1 hypothetical protein EV207_10372 [Scopulibacillus darangshiensis]